MKYKTWYYKLFNWFLTTIISPIKWPSKSYLDKFYLEEIFSLLKDSNYIILIYRKNHLTTYLIGIMTYFMTGKWPKYSHALMNIEQDTNFKLIEATGKGTNFVPFENVFDCHKACLLTPKNMTKEGWEAVVKKAHRQLGKPYDSLGSYQNDEYLTCIELVKTSLMAERNYFKNFSNFESLMNKEHFLFPDMVRDCGDFEIIYEVP